MSGLVLDVEDGAMRLGLKGPRAAEWLETQGARVPEGPNRWRRAPLGAAQRLLVARLGQTEFFLEDEEGGAALAGVAAALDAGPAGVYPVLREDFAFQMSGAGVHDALAQVCNVNFAALDLLPQPLVMTLMIGVAVLVVPEGPDEARQYRFWCDPTFGPSLSEELGTVVVECGGIIRGVTA
jgi:sarcosine oxidase, subunit gamma